MAIFFLGVIEGANAAIQGDALAPILLDLNAVYADIWDPYMSQPSISGVITHVIGGWFSGNLISMGIVGAYAGYQIPVLGWIAKYISEVVVGGLLFIGSLNFFGALYLFWEAARE